MYCTSVSTVELSQGPRLLTYDRPDLDDDKHHKRQRRLKSGHEFRKRLDTKTDTVTGRQSNRDSESPEIFINSVAISLEVATALSTENKSTGRGK
jgi:hypothetical protein